MKAKAHDNKKVAVISGGLGFLGSAIARELAGAGFSVAVLYRDLLRSDAKKMLDEFTGHHISSYECDITNPKKIGDILRKIESELGPVVVGVHAAHQPITRKKVTDMNSVTFEEQFSVGVFGGFNFLNAVAALMITRKGGVLIGVTTSAVEGNESTGNFGGYISAKFALKGMLREFSSAVKKEGIRVYAVAPGFLPGGLNADLPPRLFEFAKERSVSGQLTTPLDVARAISMLVRGDEDRSTILVDGSEAANEVHTHHAF